MLTGYSSSGATGGSGSSNVSSGTVSLPTLTYNSGDGTVTIGETGKYRFFHDSDYSGVITEHSIEETTLPITDDITSYIVASYNSGSPTYSIYTDISGLGAGITAIPYTLFRNGDILSIINWGEEALGLPNKLYNWVVDIYRFNRAEGLDLGEEGTRNVVTSAGIVYAGVESTAIEEANSSVDDCYQMINNGDGTFSFTLVTQYNNTQYDNKSGTLQDLTDGCYGVTWVYRSMAAGEKRIFLIQAGENCDLNEAKASQPVEVPNSISTNALLLGRIIVLKDSNTAEQIDSAFDTKFAASTTTSHQGLTNLEGGYGGTYKHLPLYDGDDPILVENGGYFGFKTATPASVVHLYELGDAATRLIVDTQGTGIDHQSILELHTKGDGTERLGVDADTTGWEITGRGNAYTVAGEQNDLHIGYWGGADWITALHATPDGKFGFGGMTDPSTTVHIDGSFRIADGANMIMNVTSSAMAIDVDDYPIQIGENQDYSIGHVSADGTLRIAHGADLTTDPRFIINTSGYIEIGGNEDPKQPLDIKGTSGPPATSGTTQTGIFGIRGDNNSKLIMGQVAGSPHSYWIQVQDRTTLDTNYPLLLQPNGGCVSAGTLTPDPSAVFQINNSTKMVFQVVDRVTDTLLTNSIASNVDFSSSGYSPYTISLGVSGTNLYLYWVDDTGQARAWTTAGTAI